MKPYNRGSHNQTTADPGDDFPHRTTLSNGSVFRVVPVTTGVTAIRAWADHPWPMTPAQALALRDRLGWTFSPTDEEMLEALHTSCADFVNDLPDGLNTICSEQGGGLSEGQAQRIAIARSLLRDRSVMLFDEATSALDPDTERELLNNILSAHDKTIIFITHRPAVIDYCDQILKIEKI